MDTYPEDFKHGSSLLNQVSALQQAMTQTHDEELLELVSSDGLYVSFLSVSSTSSCHVCTLAQSRGLALVSEVPEYPLHLA